MNAHRYVSRTSAFRLLEQALLAVVAVLVPVMSGRSTLGAPPRDRSGQLGQRKSTATIEGLRNTLGCDHAPVLSTNGAAVDRGGEL
jgi:hypothetical protein